MLALLYTNNLVREDKIMGNFQYMTKHKQSFYLPRALARTLFFPIKNLLCFHFSLTDFSLLFLMFSMLKTKILQIKEQIILNTIHDKTLNTYI